MSTENTTPEEREPGSSAVGWVVAAAVVFAGLALILLGEEVAPPLSRGDSAPPFDLPKLSGDGNLALKDLQGRVAMINFWATWCKPCEEEMPAMERLYRELHPEGFELVAIAMDENRADVERFQQRMQLSFPILLDPRQQSARHYQTTGFPESVLLDPDGYIIERYVGPREWDHPDYVSRLRRLIR